MRAMSNVLPLMSICVLLKIKTATKCHTMGREIYKDFSSSVLLITTVMRFHILVLLNDKVYLQVQNCNIMVTVLEEVKTLMKSILFVVKPQC